MSRADEIAQGLRHPGGALTFSLIAEEYSQGHIDFDAGVAPPKFSTASYDLGRARASRLAEERAAFLSKMRAEDLARRGRVREILHDRPGLLAEFDAKMAELDDAYRHNAPLNPTTST